MILRLIVIQAHSNVPEIIKNNELDESIIVIAD